MYVPGSDVRKIEKIPKLGADCVCIDCEDGVSVNMKEQVDTCWPLYNPYAKLNEAPSDVNKSSNDRAR